MKFCFYCKNYAIYFVIIMLEVAELPARTYVTKEQFEYFKPCIQVEMDYPDKLDSVTEVYIRGVCRFEFSFVYILFIFYRIFRSSCGLVDKDLQLVHQAQFRLSHM